MLIDSGHEWSMRLDFVGIGVFITFDRENSAAAEAFIRIMDLFSEELFDVK